MEPYSSTYPGGGDACSRSQAVLVRAPRGRGRRTSWMMLPHRVSHARSTTEDPTCAPHQAPPSPSAALDIACKGGFLLNGAAGLLALLCAPNWGPSRSACCAGSATGSSGKLQGAAPDRERVQGGRTCARHQESGLPDGASGAGSGCRTLPLPRRRLCVATLSARVRMSTCTHGLLQPYRQVVTAMEKQPSTKQLFRLAKPTPLYRSVLL